MSVAYRASYDFGVQPGLCLHADGSLGENAQEICG